MKTLFVSDLDGTLLNKNAVLNKYTYNTINELISSDMNFTVATARSPWSVKKILEPLNINYPAVLMNGVCVYDIANSEFVNTEEFNEKSFKKLLPIIHKHGLSGFLYAIKNNKLISFYENVTTPHALSFMRERIEQFGKIFVKAYPITDYNFSKITPVYYTVCDKPKILMPFLNEIKNIKGIRTEFYRDNYKTDLYFLEVLSEKASKSNAVNFIKQKYGFDKVVAFGDNLNDLPLFESADYCLAVKNAQDELKNKANAVIKSNVENGVPDWLKTNYKYF